MVNEMKTFKKMSAIPTEKDFVDEVVALQKRTLKAPTFKVDMFIRWFYVNKVHSAQSFFLGRIFKVWEEFPSFHQTPPKGLRSSHLGLARNQLLHARKLIHRIDMRYAQLLKSDDCDSLDQCKRLNGAALALMFTVAMRCLPSLTYLYKVRQLMVDLEDGKADATVVKHAIFLYKEDCTVPKACGVGAPNVDDFVPPQTLLWIEELEREHGYPQPSQ
ncbi:hypothetical protein N665_0164s0033 [Sinapis alba]|nr:hypothetical protein N665_0164s0033 [Sinapis alba]KAF8105018.1 hypothetical protein N665_0164s0033 [Sinapis alba]